MSTVMLEWEIINAAIDPDDLAASEDEALIARVQQACALAREGAHADSVRAALGPVKFEWCWGNCDGDPAEYFEKPKDFALDLTSQNSDLEFEESSGDIMITARVRFPLTTKKGVDQEALESWLDEQSVYACGFVSGGWSYQGDEGSSVRVAERS